jgi:hypothetical protein
VDFAKDIAVLGEFLYPTFAEIPDVKPKRTGFEGAEIFSPGPKTLIDSEVSIRDFCFGGTPVDI